MERYPLDAISDATYWKAPSEIKMYANQFYEDLYGPRSFMKDYKTDDMAPTTRDSYVWSETTVPSSDGGWGKADWSKIRSCNFALARIETMEKTNEALMYEGEIRFFKSFYYFNKIKSFGDVPWLDKDLQTNSEELFNARSPRLEVVQHIMEDLDFAILHLPEQSPDDRLSKYAAYALKAEMCLYEGTFMKYHGLTGDYESLLRASVAASEAIINSGLFEVYSTGSPNEDFFNLFVKHELKGNIEGIMIQRFLIDIRTHNLTRDLAEPYTGYTKDFVESFLCKDGLPIGVSSLYQGDNSFDAEFVDRDPRMKQSVYNSDRPFRIFNDGTTYMKPLPEFVNTLSPTSYFILKGFSPFEKDGEKERCEIDLFTFRYGKLLLDYAEAKAELGECTQDVLDVSINKLRDRVNMPHMNATINFVDPNWPNWEVPVSPLINEIRRERRIETCAEGRRWDDLVRWKAGKILEEGKTILGAREPNSGQLQVLYPGKTRNWADKLYLLPIPLEDLAMNSKLTQNPGW
ncbi:RagB/SusD family nutrient uptake outer membrane protein [Agriterribacter sp.]|uniref:RagB/SusD family nutrient uptake outer membrane protein n=1 Tax=Agriterribacter sp. TaxID=2821509 RepID=UPI002BF7003A|nr:RagB/SusD family nutrient uptake outer membrane protein [Agriterribacter sp.]HRO45904.1 RagB/SusD family nutrient uptake outer membrane protein [Agriterribacter sp.]HRO97269.1 RagB/SusD family nutrient uptake outer membrane protein [Ferruginibacter sp.]